jgi:hypothetical protein
MASFLNQQPTLSKKQNSRLNETDSNRRDSKKGGGE